MSYFEELKKFISQSEEGGLKHSHYLKNYHGLSVKVSFGQTIQANVPWIAFLNNIDQVQEGIYPVFLYYKKIKLLILAYGVSETRHSKREWSLQNTKTISQYFSENNLGKPSKYGSSFVFKTYDLTSAMKQDEMDKDLNTLLNIYKQTEDMNNQASSQNFEYKNFNADAAKIGLMLDSKSGLRFVASLLTKPFVIITGLSGSGKTKLAQAFVMWICEHKNQYCVVPVGADWTNREPLLGFPNALNSNEYVKPDNRTLDLIISANKDPDNPYFLILDEMNLSHVERYFADFLSAMESSEHISLYSEKDTRIGCPSKIFLSKNLFIIGTVNIDETTYMFSPKVLDRANVIEFRVTHEEMEEYLTNNTILNLELLKPLGSGMAMDFVRISQNKNLKAKNVDQFHKILLNFFEELKKIGAEFGYRSASEIARFAAIVNLIEPSWSNTEIIDVAIMQKLLPKVHGSRRKLAPVLETLGMLCFKDKIKEGEKIDTYLNPKEGMDFRSKIRFPLSFEKISRMYKGLLDNGFTSYAEA